MNEPPAEKAPPKRKRRTKKKPAKAAQVKKAKKSNIPEGLLPPPASGRKKRLRIKLHDCCLTEVPSYSHPRYVPYPAVHEAFVYMDGDQEIVGRVIVACRDVAPGRKLNDSEVIDAVVRGTERPEWRELADRCWRERQTGLGEELRDFLLNIIEGCDGFDRSWATVFRCGYPGCAEIAKRDVEIATPFGDPWHPVGWHIGPTSACPHHRADLIHWEKKVQEWYEEGHTAVESARSKALNRAPAIPSWVLPVFHERVRVL